MDTDRNRFRLLVSAGFLVLMFLQTGCENTKGADSTISQPARKVAAHSYGEPGPGKIAVIIRGDVKCPGKYYLDEGTSLESALSFFGGWGNRGDGGAVPSKAIVTRMKEGAVEKNPYRFWKMTKGEREAVILKDGDTLSFPTIIF